MNSEEEHTVRASAAGRSARPAWVESLGVPAWVTDASGCISYLNARAEAFFGHSLDDWRGRPCYAVVAGRSHGATFCCPRCRARVLADARREIEPVRMEISVKDGVRVEVCVVVVAVDTREGRQLVHMVVDDEREQRMRRYLESVMGRTLDAAEDGVRPSRGVTTDELTRREREILAMLATDSNLHEIAVALSVSHVTVRNHVQHILAKLGVHSTLEAVAVWLLDEPNRR
jgi:PAS domain S-box-containing protein